MVTLKKSVIELLKDRIGFGFFDWLWFRVIVGSGCNDYFFTSFRYLDVGNFLLIKKMANCIDWFVRYEKKGSTFLGCGHCSNDRKCIDFRDASFAFSAFCFATIEIAREQVKIVGKIVNCSSNSLTCGRGKIFVIIEGKWENRTSDLLD